MQVLGFQTGHHLSVRDVRRMHEYGLVGLGCKNMICDVMMLYLYDTTCHEILVTSRFRVVFGLFFLAVEPCYGHEVPGESEFPEDMSDEDAMSNLDSNFTKPKSLGKKSAFDDVDEHRLEVKIIENHRNDKVRLVRSCSDLSRPSYLNRFNHCKWQFQRHLRAGL